jgi:hypothetical protein
MGIYPIDLIIILPIGPQWHGTTPPIGVIDLELLKYCTLIAAADLPWGGICG